MNNCTFDYRAFENNTFDVCAPVPVVETEAQRKRNPGPPIVIYREGEISYWWERRQRVEDEEMIIL